MSTAQRAIELAREETARWVRLFNKLERHVSRHHDAKAGTGFCDDADDTLHRGWRQVMKEATGECCGSGCSRCRRERA